MPSNAVAIRDVIVQRLSLMLGPEGKRFKRIQKEPLPQFQPDQYPGVAAYVLRSNYVPDGNGNEGSIRFITDDTIMIVFGRKGGTIEATKALADSDADDVMELLFTDAEFTALAPGCLFESIEQIERTRVDPQEGDSYYSFVRLAITFRSREEYLAKVTDPYRGATVTVKPLDPGAMPQGEYHWDEDNDE